MGLKTTQLAVWLSPKQPNPLQGLAQPRHVETVSFGQRNPRIPSLVPCAAYPLLSPSLVFFYSFLLLPYPALCAPSLPLSISRISLSILFSFSLQFLSLSLHQWRPLAPSESSLKVLESGHPIPWPLRVAYKPSLSLSLFGSSSLNHFKFLYCRSHYKDD